MEGGGEPPRGPDPWDTRTMDESYGHNYSQQQEFPPQHEQVGLGLPQTYVGRAVPSDMEKAFEFVSQEDREFLEQFGKTLGQVTGAACLLGAGGCYGAARQLGWRKCKTMGVLGGIFAPLPPWYYMVNNEKEKVARIAKKMQMDRVHKQSLQMDMQREAMDEQAQRRQDAVQADHLSKLFPPAPTAGLSGVQGGLPSGFSGVPGGFPGAGVSGMPGLVPGMPGTVPGGFPGMAPPKF